jgi:hypothetical protein
VRRIRRLVILFLTAGLVLASPAYSDEAEDLERHVKSAFVYQFTKFIEWPVFDGDFVINVIEDDALGKVLEGVTSSKTVGERKIKVQVTKWANVILNCGQIVVFPKNDSPLLKPALDKLKEKPCMTIVHAEGMAAAGAVVNFFLMEGKLRFELNLRTADKKGLKVDSKLVGLAKIIE